jgi:hypothetical protein
MNDTTLDRQGLSNGAKTRLAFSYLGLGMLKSTGYLRALTDRGKMTLA